MYRGVCVDNRDPSGWGRIRVQVPQLLGVSMSGWAFPSWGVGDLQIWGEDRLPKIGQGVWVEFDGGDWDKLVWTGVFGEVELPEQLGDTQWASTVTASFPAMTYGTQATVTGTLSSENGVPNPNPDLYLEADDGSGWQILSSFEPLSDGTFSARFFPLAGSVQYRVRFPGIGRFQPASSDQQQADTSVGTSITTPTFPTLYHGRAFTVTGEVTAEDGQWVSSGTVILERRHLVGPDQTWTTVASSGVVNNIYSLTHPPLDFLGPAEWRVSYSGTNYISSVGTVVPHTVNLLPVGTLKKVGVGFDFVDFSYAAVSGRTLYRIQRKIGSGSWADAGTGTFTNVSDTGRAEYTSYYYRVRAEGADEDGATRVSAWSPTLGARTGRREQKTTGSKTNIRVNPVATGQHRNDEGWNASGRGDRLYTGYFSTTYNGSSYVGVSDYGANGVKNAIISAVGSTAYNNGYATGARIFLWKRTDVGNFDKTLIKFYTTPDDTVGNRASRTGTAVERTSTSKGQGKWYEIGKAHAQRLAESKARGVAIHKHTSRDYAAYNGRSSGTADGDLKIDWKWSYVTVSYQAPTWL